MEKALINTPHDGDIGELISSKMGLMFNESRRGDLMRGIAMAAQECGFESTDRFIDRLKSGAFEKKHIEILARHLTVGETYFFRDGAVFTALEETVLPGIIDKKRSGSRSIRIWCAGCSTGEEPYSLAILLRKLIPDIDAWGITILATDINPRSLKKASDGLYSDWSFRSTPEWVRQGYFQAEGGMYRIRPDIMQMVSFEYHNLAEDIYPSLLCNTNAMDLILCRNVLMYFSERTARGVIQGFYNCLVDGGYLALSPTDHFKLLTALLKMEQICGAVFYRKNSSQEKSLTDTRPVVLPPAIAATAHEPAQGPFKVIRETGAEAGAKETKKKTTGPEEDPESVLFDQAVELFRAGRYSRAAGMLESICGGKGHPKRPEALELLARAYANEGKLELAAERCSQAISAEALNPAAHYLLATIMQEQGRVDEAVVSLKKALYLDNSFVLAYFVLGTIMLRKGERASSARHFRNAMELLASRPSDEIIAGSEGMTAGRLSEIISSMYSNKEVQ